MTAPSQAVERSLPHEMVAWKAAAEIAQEQCIALTARVRELEAALRPFAAIPHGYILMGWNKHHITTDDVIAARAALANSPKESA